MKTEDWLLGSFCKPLILPVLSSKASFHDRIGNFYCRVKVNCPFYYQNHINNEESVEDRAEWTANLNFVGICEENLAEWGEGGLC